MKYVDLKGKDRTEAGDEYKPIWEKYYLRLPPPYGHPVKDFPGAKYRRPVRPAKVQRLISELL